jgi:hypothetical protein
MKNKNRYGWPILLKNFTHNHSPLPEPDAYVTSITSAAIVSSEGTSIAFDTKTLALL